MEADDLIAQLGLLPHPEGGWYVETWRGADDDQGRAASTAIYYLLKDTETSRWHRVDADEVWLHHAGEPLELCIAPDAEEMSMHTLGPDLAQGQRPQVVVPAHAWQSARPLGAWVLVSCLVVPGFEFSGFELAPDGWEPRT